MGNVLEQQLGPRMVLKQRNYCDMTTGELYSILLNECNKTSDTITSLQKGRRFDERGRSLLCQLTIDLEKKLHKFNKDMVGPVHFLDRADSEALHRLRNEVARLSEENKRLVIENKKTETILKGHLTATQSGVSRKSTDNAQRATVENNSQKQRSVTEKENNDHLKEIMKQLNSRLQDQEEDIRLLRIKNESAQSFIKSLSEKTEKIESENKTLLEEKEVLTKRLSKIVSERLVDDNPAIADLSDPNRPQKLGEFYSELYDNEWTDAFDALTKSGYDDKDAIVTLRLTLINVLEFCKSKSSNLLKKTEEAVNFLFEEYRDFQEKKSQKHLTLKRSQSEQWLKARDSSFDGEPDECVDVQKRWKPKYGKQEPAKEQESEMVQKHDVIVQKLKVFRKEVAESMVPMVQKAYIAASWKSECILELKPFIKKCIFLGWMMVVQSPPMCLTTCEEGERFDKNKFKEYTKSGPTVDFVVWPALYLHENGPLIGKGVAEARK
ncbi:uncharacterized protein LOC132755870 [Ruditapes philippinarum]|uniref:uncharacterized protein LOC132755870 n=1 Tax=Ruditapes philippinarum TaxID=129788 RepID=UPI00295AFB77|nr:uncharacterized protein LOC132755870 [Ruditapes philippinarum]